MNRKNLYIAVLLLCCSFVVNGQRNESLSSDSLAPNEIYLRFDGVSGGGPKWLTARTVSQSTLSGSTVKVGREYERVSNHIFEEMEQKSSATYWYNVVQEEDSLHFLVHARTSKNAIGIGSSCLFFGDFKSNRNRLLDELKDNFDDVAYRLCDVSVGVSYARQLYGVNRHRLTFETEPGYRYVYQSFSADHYGTSYPAVDPDGYAYERLVSAFYYEEKRRIYCVDVPVALRYDIFVLKNISLFLSGGLDNVFVVKADGEAKFDATYAGRYGDDLFNTLIDENGYYDFGHYTANQIIKDKESGFEYMLYGTGALGVQYFVGSLFSVELAAVYQHHLVSVNPAGTPETYCLSEAPDTYQSMAYTMKPSSKNRIGINVKMKINF